MNKLKKEFQVSADYILYGEVKDVRHWEFEFEGMSENEQLSVMIRLLVHLCRLDEQSENLIEEIEKLICKKG